MTATTYGSMNPIDSPNKEELRSWHIMQHHAIGFDYRPGIFCCVC